MSRTTYASLFSAVGIAHGGNDGTTTFNLPDYRGLFLRGVDAGANRDSDAASRSAAEAGAASVTGGPGNPGDAVGSVQTDAFQGHWHETWYRTSGGGNDPRDGAPVVYDSSKVYAHDMNECMQARTPVSDGVNGFARTGLETRPKNAYVYYIIKY